MASTVPYVPNPAWADGSGGGTPVTGAKLNTLEQGVTDAHLMPAVRVFHNTNQSIANNTETSLAFNSERFDQAGGASATQHDTATNNSRLTCRYAGVYWIHAQVDWSTSPNGGLVELRVNGTTKIASADAVTVSDTRRQQVGTMWALAVNDYVEVRVTQINGAAINVINFNSESPEFMMVRVA